MLLIIFGGFVVVLSSQMPDFADQNANPYSAPGVVPSILGVIFIILGLIMFIRSILRKGYRLGITGTNISAWFRDKTTHRFLITLSLSVIYALILLGRMHFLLATGLYMFAFVVLFEYKRGVGPFSQIKTLLLALLLAVLTSGSVYWVFRYLFLVNFPG
jgi:hypothetical protein